MLHILWLIIKFVLIILGIVFSLLLLILLLLLFCPVRYAVQGYKPEGGGKDALKGQIKVSWLLHGITFRIFYEEGKAGTHLGILGISPEIFRRKKKEKKKKQQKKEENQQRETAKELLEEKPSVKEEKTEREEASVKEDSFLGEKASARKNQEKHKEDIEEEKKAGLLKRIVGKIKSIPSKIRKIRLTIKRTCVKIEWWKEFFSNPRIKEAISFCWKDIKKLLHHILPTKVEGKVTFGCEDPSLTGGIVAFLGMSIPFHKNCIQVTPLFQSDRNILEGNVKMKGRIYGIVLLKTAAEIYFNKNIKYMINRWKHKEA